MYRREIIVHQHKISGVARNVRSVLSHGDSDIRRLQGRGVVYAVSGHRRRLVEFLEAFHNSDFMFRRHPGKDL